MGTVSPIRQQLKACAYCMAAALTLAMVAPLTAAAQIGWPPIPNTLQDVQTDLDNTNRRRAAAAIDLESKTKQAQDWKNLLDKAEQAVKKGEADRSEVAKSNPAAIPAIDVELDKLKKERADAVTHKTEADTKFLEAKKSFDDNDTRWTLLIQKRDELLGPHKPLIDCLALGRNLFNFVQAVGTHVQTGSDAIDTFHRFVSDARDATRQDMGNLIGQITKGDAGGNTFNKSTNQLLNTVLKDRAQTFFNKIRQNVSGDAAAGKLAQLETTYGRALQQVQSQRSTNGSYSCKQLQDLLAQSEQVFWDSKGVNRPPEQTVIGGGY